MKILITGATGMVGRNLLKTLDLRRNSAILFIKDRSSDLVRDIPRSGIKVVKGDVRNFEDCRNAMEGVGLVIHLAAIVGGTNSIKNPKKTLDVNTFGTLGIMEAMRLCDVNKLIFPSTIGVYGNNVFALEDEINKIEPLTPYDLSKVLAEQICSRYSKLYGMKYIILRLSHLYGRHQDRNHLVPSLIDKILKNRTIEIGNDVSRDFMNVEDVADVIVRLLNFSSNNIFNVGTSIETKISELIHLISELYEKEVEIKYNPRIGRESRFERWRERANTRRMEKELGWKFKVDLKNGLKSLTEEELWKKAN